MQCSLLESGLSPGGLLVANIRKGGPPGIGLQNTEASVLPAVCYLLGLHMYMKQAAMLERPIWPTVSEEQSCSVQQSTKS